MTGISLGRSAGRRVAIERVVRAVAVAAASFVAATPAAAQDDAPLVLRSSVRGAPVGTELFLSTLEGLPSERRVSIGFGGLSGGYELLGRAETGPGGELLASVTVPSWAEPNVVYFFFLNLGGGTRVFTEPFLVTGADGALEVAAQVTQVTEGCVVAVGLGQTPYVLAGVATPVTVGDLVTVTGTLGAPVGEGEGPACVVPAALRVSARSVRIR